MHPAAVTREGDAGACRQAERCGRGGMLSKIGSARVTYLSMRKRRSRRHEARPAGFPGLPAGFLPALQAPKRR